jgi:hypothetical protein
MTMARIRGNQPLPLSSTSGVFGSVDITCSIGFVAPEFRRVAYCPIEVCATARASHYAAAVKLGPRVHLPRAARVEFEAGFVMIRAVCQAKHCIRSSRCE